MTTTQDDYFDALELSNVLRERIVTLQSLASSLNPENIGSVFVTSYVNDDGVITYENLWLISQHFVMEWKGFQINQDIDMAVIWKAVQWWNVTMSEFDLAKSTPQSGMTLRAQIDGVAVLDMRAVGRNCEYLAEFLRTSVVPNVRV